MDRPKLVQATGSFFGGAPRTYTRAIWYRQDEADFNANMHDEDVRNIQEKPLEDLDEDPYAEGREQEMPAGPGEIEQIRKDFRDPLLLQKVKENWRIGDSVGQTAQMLAAQEIQMRAEVRRAIEQATQQQSLFDTNYARCVPEALRNAFLSTPEAEQVCNALVPMLLTQAAVAEQCQIHLTEQQLMRHMFTTGCTFHNAETRILVGHVAHHAPSDAADLYRGTYGDFSDETLHCHWNGDENTTTMRILVFLMSPDDYQVRLVCHVVDKDVLCFRTFQFMRPLETGKAM